MNLALDADHSEFAASVANTSRRAAPRDRLRADLEALSRGGRPDWWGQMVDSGLLSAHLPEDYDGAGDAMATAAGLEAAAGQLLPGPLLPTVAASAVVGRRPGSAAASGALKRFGDGAVGACATTTGGLRARNQGDGWVVEGTVDAVLGTPGAEILILGARVDGDGDAPGSGDVWFAVDGADVTVEDRPGLDLTRSIGRVTLSGHAVPADAVLDGLGTGLVRDVYTALAAAEAVGVAGWCHHEAVEYLKVREQFGVKIGTFQGLKHKAARLFVRLETMTAAAWDAARALGEDDDDQLAQAAATAALVVLPGAVDMGLDCLQLFGGIGFTWEHDLHFYWRRAQSLQRLLAPTNGWARALGERARQGQSRRFEPGQQYDDPGFRSELRPKLEAIAALPEEQRWAAFADEGLVSEHYPRPYGIEATPAQQLVLQSELDRLGLTQPSTVIGRWVLPSLIQEGSDEQRERFMAPTLRGEIEWCQLYSEPGAGSDLAGLSTKATRTDGGWLLTGQKVWNSRADRSDWAICLARTDPTAPKHKGISYFLVDMKSPGIDVRPLQQVDRMAEFNEVFLDEVFVPNDCLVGQENDGWRITRSALGNERMSIARDLGARTGADPVAVAARDDLVADEGSVTDGLGRLTAGHNAISAMGLRIMLRQLNGMDPGPGASALKLASNTHLIHQFRTEADWLGPEAAIDEATAEATWALGDAELTDQVVNGYLRMPQTLIGGGTEEIQLNIVAEWILGLPRK